MPYQQPLGVSLCLSALLCCVSCIEDKPVESDPQGGETGAAGEIVTAGVSGAGGQAGVGGATQPVMMGPAELDILFVIDNSNSMCEEQIRLAEQLDRVSQLLLEDRSDVDYRVAVVSTDIGTQTDPPRGNVMSRGAFQYAPASADSPPCGDLEGNPIDLNTADCDPSADPVISAAQLNALPEAERRAELTRQLRCRTTLGIGGYLYEKGLEAMRLSLSCNGPNADHFSACCVPQGEGSVYDPACSIEEGETAPSFLRPNATLAVVILSDENDCSTPADSAEPGNTCEGEACDISYTQSIECEWFSDRLTPVSQYVDFLRGLKADPERQLVVLPIVGFRAYTEAGNPISYRNGEPLMIECNDSDHPDSSSEACCPEGVCVGVRQVSAVCSNFEQAVLSYPGTRYLELAEQLNPNSFGCASGAEPEVLESGALQPQEGARCDTICQEDYSSMVNELAEKIEASLPAP